MYKRKYIVRGRQAYLSYVLSVSYTHLVKRSFEVSRSQVIGKKVIERNKMLNPFKRIPQIDRQIPYGQVKTKKSLCSFNVANINRLTKLFNKLPLAFPTFFYFYNCRTLIIGSSILTTFGFL